MRKILFGVLITLIILFTFKYCGDKKEDQIILQENSVLIQEQLKNVSKIVVTEGHFSEVFNYKNSKEIFGEYITSDKKALVVVNADVSVAYDLSKIEYEIDEINKTLNIISVPKEEIKISPDFEYYDIQDDFLNQFKAKDYNEIKNTINASLIKKINASNLVLNAQNRLISELSKLFFLTKSLGWKLKYNKQQIETGDSLEKLLL